METLIVTDHFMSLDYLKLLYSKKYESLQEQMQYNIIGTVIFFIVSLITLITTFNFLQIKSLSLIPLASLILISVSLIALFVNYIRYTVINKVIKGEYRIDEKFLKLVILKTKMEEQEEHYRSRNRKQSRRRTSTMNKNSKEINSNIIELSDNTRLSE
jgi:small-conductance mechanosensitive channel